MNTEEALHKAVVNELVIATPEWWKFARLELSYVRADDKDRCEHSISNPQFPKDYVEPTDELFEATRNVVLYYKKLGQMWRGADYEITERDGEWTFTVQFTY